MTKVTEHNTSLFEIRSTRISIEDVIEELGGEVTPEIEEALRINQEQLSKKGESYIYMLEQLHAYTEMNKRYVEQAMNNIDRAKATAERLESNLLEAAKLFGKFEAGIHTVSTRKSESIIITDENELSDLYVSKKVVRTPDKKLIKEAIKGGLTVEGAELKENKNLKIS